MTATVETMNDAPSDVDAMKKENFDAGTAMDLLEEAGLSDLDNVFFANDLKGISDLVTAGGPQDLELAKRMYERLNDDINWAKNRDNDNISDAQAEAIGDLLAAAIGDEGIAKLDGSSESGTEDEGSSHGSVELYTPKDDKELIDGAVAIFKQELANRDADAVMRVYESVAEAISNTEHDADRKEELFLEFVDKTGEGLSQEEHDWLNQIDYDASKLKAILHANESGIEGESDDEEEDDDAPSFDELHARMAEVDEERERQEAEDNESIKDRIKANLKARWGKLKTAAITMDVKLATEAVFGNEDGEKTKRNALIALGVGATALAAVIANSKGWVDLNPFDGNGIDLNPFDNSPKTGTATEVINNTPNPAENTPTTGGAGTKIAESVGHGGNTYTGPNPNSSMPWTVANAVSPGNESSVMQQAMDNYATQTGMNVRFTGTGVNTMIQVGDHIANNSDIKNINELMINRVV